MIKHMTDDELEKLARRIWYAPKRVASNFTDGKGRVTKKIAWMDQLGINGRETEFNAPLGGRQVGQWHVEVQYPRWDFPGMITVRKVGSQEE